MKTSTEFLRTPLKIVLTSLLLLSFQACGDLPDDGSQLHRANNGGGTAGGKCEVTSGPNKGKTGTYDGEGWCTGSWGGTECKALDGSSKCKDIAKSVIVQPIIVKPIVGVKL